MITSIHNPKIQRVRALLNHRQERDAAGVLVVEGVRLAEEAQVAGWDADLVLFSAALTERGRLIVERFGQTGTEIEEVPSHLMEAISGTETPQGILAVLRQKKLTVPPQVDFVLIADAVRDPGNLGTLLRTAAAAAVQAVLLAPGTVDPFSPKVLRAGMGAHFRLPIHNLDWEKIQAMCKPLTGQTFLHIYTAEADRGTPCWSLDLRQPVALVVGGEADGVSQEAHRLAEGAISIPMPGRSESLNAAVAASILLFEIVRQRTQP